MKKYRVIFESYEEDFDDRATKTVIMEGLVKTPEDIFSLGFAQEEQIGLIQALQDNLLREQPFPVKVFLYCGELMAINIRLAL